MICGGGRRVTRLLKAIQASKYPSTTIHYHFSETSQIAAEIILITFKSKGSKMRFLQVFCGHFDPFSIDSNTN